MSKCPYNSSSDPCEFEVQLMVANVAEVLAAGENRHSEPGKNRQKRSK